MDADLGISVLSGPAAIRNPTVSGGAVSAGSIMFSFQFQSRVSFLVAASASSCFTYPWPGETHSRVALAPAGHHLVPLWVVPPNVLLLQLVF